MQRYYNQLIVVILFVNTSMTETCSYNRFVLCYRHVVDKLLSFVHAPKVQQISHVYDCEHS